MNWMNWMKWMRWMKEREGGGSFSFPFIYPLTWFIRDTYMTMVLIESSETKIEYVDS